MPQLTSAVLTDGAAIGHTFTPASIAGGVATLVESTGVPLGDKKLTASSTQTSQGRRKVTYKLSVPVMQDAVSNGVSRPTAVRTAYASLEFSFDPTSNVQERSDVRSMIVSLLQDTNMRDLIDHLTTLY